MAEYIEKRKALLTKFTVTQESEYAKGWNDAIDAIVKNACDFTDVVEVVRCKDCQCWDKLDGYDYIGMCDYHLHTVYDDAFCSYGERREEMEYSFEFDKLRKNRVEVSFHKYGPASKNFGEGRVDALETAQLCIDAFRKDHNTEHLVDAANYLMFRFMFPLPGERFCSTSSAESVGTVGTPINLEK